MTDFHKHALLRFLSGRTACDEARKLRLGVIWYFNPDLPSDETVTRALNGERSKNLDQPLWQELRTILSNGTKDATLDCVQASDIYPRRTLFFGEAVGIRGARLEWFERAQEVIADVDVVFFDPDTGLEVPSISRGSAAASSYCYFDELKEASAGKTLVVYQSLLARSIPDEIHRRLRQLRIVRGGAGEACAIYIGEAHSCFFVLMHAKHVTLVKKRLLAFERTWNKKARLYPDLV